jgi:hypothetical protein
MQSRGVSAINEGGKIMKLQENAMKLTILSSLAAVSLIAVSTTSFAADTIIVSSNKAAPALSSDQKATMACMNAFIAELRLGDSMRVRTVMPADREAIFRFGDTMPAFYRIMLVEMTANSAHGNDLLAKSVCKVNRDARVVHLTTQITDRAKLAGLTVNDVRLAMSTH